MARQNSPYALMLDLVEQRIEQMDVFNPHDETDLDALLHCRETLKAAVHASTPDERERYVDTLRMSAMALGNLHLIQEVLSPSMDVV
jgi:hypothetical protein